MKKEYLLAIAFGFFLLASILDYIAGPVFFTLAHPFGFFTQYYLNQYPLTAVAIALRSISIFLFVSLAFSLIEKNFFGKAITLFIIGVLAILYAIQQVKTGMRTTSLQITLSIAHAALLLSITIVYNIILGIIDSLKEKLTSSSENNNEE